jgi:hypothetical protein
MPAANRIAVSNNVLARFSPYSFCQMQPLGKNVMMPNVLLVDDDLTLSKTDQRNPVLIVARFKYQ